MSELQDVITQADIDGGNCYLESKLYSTDSGEKITIPDKMMVIGESHRTTIDLAVGSKIILPRENSGIKHLQIIQSWQNPANPIDQTAIEIGERNFTLQDILMPGVGTGIRLEGNASGLISHVRGFATHCFMDFYHTTHIVRVSDCEAWPIYWPGSGMIAMETHTKWGGSAMKFNRCDNAQISNFFSYGYCYGMFFNGTSKSNASHRIVGTNVAHDLCRIGLFFRGRYDSAIMTNYTYHGSDYHSRGVYMHGESSNNKVQVMTGNFAASTHEAVRIGGTKNKGILTNSVVRSHGLNGKSKWCWVDRKSKLSKKQVYVEKINKWYE